MGNDPANVVDARIHRRERDESSAGRAGDHPGERGFSGPWRSPENQRGNLLRLHRSTQEVPRTGQMLLADEFIEGPRPHPFREGLSSRRSEEHTSELQSHLNLVCRLLLEKKKTTDVIICDYA